jgi:hypothetical protein
MRPGDANDRTEGGANQESKRRRPQKWPRWTLALCLAVLVVPAWRTMSMTASAQSLLYEIHGDTWLDLNMDGIRSEGEPLVGQAEIWSLSDDGSLGNRSRSDLNGHYVKRQTDMGNANVLALVQGINNGDGQRAVLLAPPRLATFREAPTRVDLGLFEAPKPHDERYFPDTDRRIRDNPVWGYFTTNGGVAEFGRPLSDPFIFTCCWMQIFEYGALNVSGAYLGVARMNVLDADILGIDVLDGGVRVPAYDPSLPATQIPQTSGRACDDGKHGFVGRTVGQGPGGVTTELLDEYLRATVPDDPGLFQTYCLIGLERWGLPTSPAVTSPNGDGGVMQRFQRGVMWYRADCACVRRVPFGETLRRAFRGDDSESSRVRTAAVFGLFAPELLHKGPAVHVNLAVGILATGGPPR